VLASVIVNAIDAALDVELADTATLKAVTREGAISATRSSTPARSSSGGVMP
jgi:hypothetical protein